MQSDTMRTVYRDLTPIETKLMADIKFLGSQMYEKVSGIPDARMRAIARTKIEEAVMWAVKGITG